MATDPKYNCVRPDCLYESKSFDYYRGSVNPEQSFVLEGVTYDYFEDYESWNHVERVPFYPLGIGPGNAIPAVSSLNKVFGGYGYNYSSHIGAGNPLYTWYSHTDLDIEIMKKIKDEIRGPIIEKVKEAKATEDKYKEWVVYKRLLESGTEVVAPEGEEVTCSDVKEKINAIPLECELIKEVLGEEWSGCDLNNYWWYGWLPTGWLEKDFGPNNDRVPYGATSGDVPSPYMQHSAATPPYQSVIGAYECPVIEVDEETGEIEATPHDPWNGAFGNFSSDPCGCINEEDIENIKKPDYIEKCQFPKAGERYPEYLEYVRSIDARYWNTPLKTPLLRKAQIELIKAQRLQITAAVDLTVRVGDVVNLALSPSIATDLPDDDQPEESILNGKWLVVAIKHSITPTPAAKMKVTLMRDSHSKEPITDGVDLP